MTEKEQDFCSRCKEKTNPKKQVFLEQKLIRTLMGTKTEKK